MTLLRALFDVPKATDDYKSIAKWVMTLFKANNRLMYLMQIAIRQEVHCTHIGMLLLLNSWTIWFTLVTDALFREDTMVCILASSFLKTAGADYLQKILGPPILKIAHSKKSFEVSIILYFNASRRLTYLQIDLHKPGGHKNNEERVRKLVASLIKSIFDSSEICPAYVY